MIKTLKAIDEGAHRLEHERLYASNAVKKVKADVTPKDFAKLGMLGRGDVGKVYLVRKKESSRLLAMKVLSKQDMIKRKKVDRVLMEQRILLKMNHPFLVTLHYTFQTSTHLYFCMEYCPGGEFFKALQSQPGKCLSEADARFYTAEVILALEYLHLMGFIYRDLKPENVLLRESGHIVLSDFDLAKNDVFGYPTLQKGTQRGKHPRLNTRSCVQTLRTNSFVGTEEYIAPEIVVGQYHDSSVDWWTLGIFVYEMLYATTPFKGNSRNKTFHNILMLPLSLPPTSVTASKGYFQSHPRMISGPCKSFLGGLLTKDPKRRLGYRTGAGDVRAHKWFRDINFALLRHTKPPLQPKCCDYATHTPTGSLECGLPLYDKEARIPTDEVDPFDKFCSVTIQWNE
ncbi:kinase-like domain-containing protein [Umbelopsis sp. AD052]|nr:kinase-like domain-containing protein [Umbelopsis sp. AD052]